MTNPIPANVHAAIIRRLRVVPVTFKGRLFPTINTFNIQLMSMGWSVSNPQGIPYTVNNVPLVISTLQEMKGGDFDLVPLFQNFPDDIPSNEEVLLGHIVLYFSRQLGLEIDTSIGLSSIPQTKEQFDTALSNQAKRTGDTKYVLHPLEVVSAVDIADRVRVYIRQVLTAGSSIKEEWRDDVRLLMETYGVPQFDLADITFKENAAFVAEYAWNHGAPILLNEIISSSTDMLRLFASLTDSDVSLSTPIKFPKFTRPQRRMILSTLERLNGDLENLWRYRGLWLKIGKGLHVRSYRKRYPKTFNAFFILRNGKYESFASQVEQAYLSKNHNRVLQLLSSRPGEFARGLHRAVRVIGRLAILEFKKVGTEVPLKNLMVMETYFRTIGGQKNRSFFLKNGRLKTIENKLQSENLKSVQKAITSIILTKTSEDGHEWQNKKVYIDPELSNYIVPLQQRKGSDSLISVGRGTRLPLDTSSVMRLFVYWKDDLSAQTDLDLSAIILKDGFKYHKHVSYTRLASNGAVHSGDLVSAPHGATEFIDLDVNTIRKDGGRYLVPNIYRFSGSNFEDLPIAMSGWMSRTHVDGTYKSFDVKTVENAFTLKGNAKYCIPFIVDLVENKIIYTDLYVGKTFGGGYGVESELDSVQVAVQAIADMGKTKPNLETLAIIRAIGRKALKAASKEDADITIGISDCDFNAMNPEQMLAEFL